MQILMAGYDGCDVPAVLSRLSPGAVISVKLPQITTVPSAPPAPGPRCNLDQDLTFHLVFVSISLNVVGFIYFNFLT